MLTFIVIAVGYIIGIGVCVSWVERDSIRKKQIQIEKDLEELKSKVVIETKLSRQEMLKKLDGVEI